MLADAIMLSKTLKIEFIFSLYQTITYLCVYFMICTSVMSVSAFIYPYLYLYLSKELVKIFFVLVLIKVPKQKHLEAIFGLLKHPFIVKGCFRV